MANKKKNSLIDTALPPIVTAVQSNPVSKFLLGGAMNVAQDIGAGISANQTAAARGGANTEADKTASALEAQATQSQDPTEKVALLKQANDLRANVSATNADVAKTFSPDVQGNPLLRGAGAGVEIGTAADVLAHPVETVKGVYNAVRHPIQTIKGVAEGVGNFVKDPIGTVKNLPWDAEHSFKLDIGDNNLTKTGNRFLTSQYKNPGAITQNPSEVTGQLADYGITSPDHVEKSASVLTGKDGVVTKRINRALKLTDPIDPGDILEQAKTGLQGVTKGAPNEIKNAYNFVKNESIKATGAGDIGELYKPDKLFQATQNLDAQAAEHFRSYQKSGNLVDKQLGQYYANISDIWKQKLYSGATDAAGNIIGTGLDKALEYTPFTKEELDLLSGVSPKLAETASSTVGGKELRKMTAPFVKGSQMVSSTNKAANVGINLNQEIGLASSIMSGNPVGAGLAMASTQPGKNAIGNTLRTVGKMYGSGSLPQITLDAAGQVATNALKSTNPINNAEQPNNGADNENKHTIPSIAQPQSIITRYDQIPQGLDQVKADPSGNYAVPNPQNITGPDGQSLALSPQTYQLEVNKLNKLRADAYGDPYTQGQIDAQIKSLESKKSVSDEMSKSWTITSSINDKIARARSLLQNAPVDLLSLNNSVDKLRKAANGQYAQLAQALDDIEKTIPGVSLYGQTSDVALGNLNQANQFLLNSYYKSLNRFTGGTTGTGQPVGSGQQLPAIIPNNNSPPPQGIKFGGGNIPSLNLPPIDIVNTMQYR